MARTIGERAGPRARRRGFLQTIFRTQPLASGDWLLELAVGSTAIIGGELDKWRNRRLGRLLG